VSDLLYALENLPPENLLAQTVQWVGVRLDYIDVGILLIDSAQPDQLLLYASNYAGFPEAVGNYRQPIYGGIIGRCMRIGQQVVIEDVSREPEYGPVPGLAIQAEVVTPLFVRGHLRGVLNVESLHPISAAEVETLARVGAWLEKRIDATDG
jgi:putative methionine-R-sulfoxide reductase with GAF domain